MISRKMPPLPEIPTNLDKVSKLLKLSNHYAAPKREYALISALMETEVVPFDPAEIETFKKNTLALYNKEYPMPVLWCVFAIFCLGSMAPTALTFYLFDVPGIWYNIIFVNFAASIGSMILQTRSEMKLDFKKKSAGLQYRSIWNGVAEWNRIAFSHVDITHVDPLFLKTALKIQEKLPEATFSIDSLNDHPRVERSFARILYVAYDSGYPFYPIEIALGPKPIE